METDEDERNKNSDIVKIDKDKADKLKEKKHKNTKKHRRPDYKWIITIFVASFAITILLTFTSNEIMSDLNIAVALIILTFFILLGVIFDIIGLAIMTADEKQFHSMAARKIDSAKCAIKLIRNAEKVSSFCNDVIGDIAGVLSGATGAAVVASLFMNSDNYFVGNLIITSLIAALIVGTKAFGKSIAINNSNDIVDGVSKIIYFFQRLANFKNLKKTKKDK